MKEVRKWTHKGHGILKQTYSDNFNLFVDEYDG